MNVLGLELSAMAVALAILLGLLGLFAAMALFARNYIKVPPSMVAIFYGRKHTIVDEKGQRATVGFRVVRGGAALRVPVLERVEYLSLNVISIPLRIQRAYTKEGVAVTVEAVANVKIAGDDMSLRGAAERFLGMSTEQMAARALVGTPERVIERVREYAALGFTHFIGMFGRVDDLRSTRLFAERVLPAFRDGGVSPAVRF